MRHRPAMAAVPSRPHCSRLFVSASTRESVGTGARPLKGTNLGCLEALTSVASFETRTSYPSLMHRTMVQHLLAGSRWLQPT